MIQPSIRHKPYFCYLVGWGICLVGLVDLLCLNTHDMTPKPFSIYILEQPIGLLCLLAGPAIARHKKAAWWLAWLGLGISLFYMGALGLWPLFGLTCLVLVGLSDIRQACTVQSDPICARFSGIFLLGTLCFLGLDTVCNLFLTVVYNLQLHWWILFTTVFLFMAGVFLGLEPVWPEHLKRSQEPEENVEAKALVTQFSTQLVQHITVADGYRTFLSQSRRSYMGYLVINRIAIALGNPCGSEDPETVIQEWMTYVQDQDWMPAIFQADAGLLPSADALGLHYVKMGVQAVIPLKRFALKSALRQCINRGNRNGWFCRPFQETDWQAIDAMNQKWLEGKDASSEMLLGVGKPTLEYLNTSVARVICDANGKILAYINCVFCSGSNTWGIDLMRRDPEAPTGAMEALLLSVIQEAQQLNLDYFDLGLAPLANLENESQGVTRVLHWVFEQYNIRYDFKGLYRFKSKFNPEWHDRYVIFPTKSSIPALALALGQSTVFSAWPSYQKLPMKITAAFCSRLAAV